MNPIAVILIAIGAAGQLASLVYFFAISKEPQTLPMVVLVSFFSAVEAVGIIMLAKNRLNR